MKFHDIEQNTDEWLELRKGKFTASTFKDLMSAESTAGYKNAIADVVYERITGNRIESYTNEWMQRGHDLEPQARLYYELNYSDVDGGGFFCDEWVGASPDGLVGKDGLVEIKCPKHTTHIQYLMKSKLPSAYKWQIQGQLYVTDRKWCDFVSYHPKLPAFYIRVERDEEIEAIGVVLDKAKKQAQEIIKKLGK